MITATAHEYADAAWWSATVAEIDRQLEEKIDLQRRQRAYERKLNQKKRNYRAWWKRALAKQDYANRPAKVIRFPVEKTQRPVGVPEGKACADLHRLVRDECKFAAKPPRHRRQKPKTSGDYVSWWQACIMQVGASGLPQGDADYAAYLIRNVGSAFALKLMEDLLPQFEYMNWLSLEGSRQKENLRFKIPRKMLVEIIRSRDAEIERLREEIELYRSMLAKPPSTGSVPRKKKPKPVAANTNAAPVSNPAVEAKPKKEQRSRYGASHRPAAPLAVRRG